MADTTHTTTTTTTTTTRTSLKDAIESFAIVALFCGAVVLLAWSALVSVGWYYVFSASGFAALGFAAFGFIFSWTFSYILLALFSSEFQGSLLANLSWRDIQVTANAVFTLLCLISTCCVESSARNSNNWTASYVIVELVVGLLAWPLLVSVGFHYLGFSMDLQGICLMLCPIILVVIFTFGFHGSLCANLPWGLIQIIANAEFCALCFTSACCLASFIRNKRNTFPFRVLGFTVFTLYVVSLLITFSQAYGRLLWQATTGAPANT